MTDGSARRKIDRVLRNMTYEQIDKLRFSRSERVAWVKDLKLPVKFEVYTLKWIDKNDWMAS